jgi:hypothetical protein
MTGLPPANPPVVYATGSRAEWLFTEWAQARGWWVTKRGWPDFICRRDGELMCVEVKDGADTFSEYQRLTVVDLAARGVPVFEWRPPDCWAPDCWDPEDGQLRPVSEVQHLMTAEQVEVFTAADKAVREARNAQLLAESRCGKAENRAEGRMALVKAARAESARLREDNDRLRADAVYLVRRILDCPSRYFSKRLLALMRRYGERSACVPLPDGKVVTVRPCGTGWPS